MELSFRLTVCERHSYDIVLQFLKEVSLPPADADEFGAKLYCLDDACHSNELHF